MDGITNIYILTQPSHCSAKVVRHPKKARSKEGKQYFLIQERGIHYFGSRTSSPNTIESKMQQYGGEEWTSHQYSMDYSQVRAHSVLSAGSGFDDYQDPYAYPAFTQDHIDEINAEYEATRAYRIRRAMFPETIDESTSATGFHQQYDFGQSTNVQRLADPSQMLKTSVVNIINYQDDAEITMKAIPELVKLLCDSDQAVVAKAAMILHHLSKSDAALAAMANNQDLINAIVALTKNSDNPDVIRYAAGTLYNISRHDRGVLAIFQSGGIPALVRLLSSPIDSVVFYAITTLHNLLQHLPGAKDQVRVAGGVPKMVALLQKRHDKFLAIDTDCLQILACEHPETKMMILSCGGPAELVKIMRTSQYEKLLWTTSRLLQVLSVCAHNKPAIIAAGGVQALSLHLNNQPGQRLVLSCLLTLRNLSDAATKEENIEGLLKSLIQLLDSSDPKVVACSVGVLSNLTCNNQRNKAGVCRSGGVEALIRVLQQYGGYDDISEAALCTLRHLTCRHPDVEMAQNAVRLNFGIQQVCRYVQSPLPPTIRQSSMKAALGLIRNLVNNNGANLTAFREHGTVKNVCAHLITAFQQVQQSQRNGNGHPPVVDGVSAMEVVENAAGALHVLAKDPLNRTVIRQLNIIPILVQLLYYDIENIQRFATGCIAELAVDREGGQVIEQQGAVAPLTELLHSRNENISTYAGAAMHRLSKDKPAEYQKRLSLEISSSLMRDDSAPWGQDGTTEITHMQEDGFGEGSYPSGFGGQPPVVGHHPGNAGSVWDSSFSSSTHQHPAVGYTPAGPPQAPPRAGAQQHASQQMPGWYDTDL